MTGKPLRNHCDRIPGELEERNFPGELHFSLLPIAAVGEKRRSVIGDQERAGASREA